jgi:hypothetical protein
VLLVVFGAGASYDSVPTYQPRSWRVDGLQQRPPLANDLFDERTLFADTALRLYQLLPILPRLRHRADNVTVEAVLQQFQTEAGQDHQRYRQLTAIRYYLHYTLLLISERWQLDIVNRNGSNYHTLLDHIRHHRAADEQVALVTFNYDTLLENALKTVDVPTNNVSDYIAHGVYKVFKLHGSVRWAHPIETHVARENRHFWEILGEIIQRAPELKVGGEFVNVPNHLLADVEHTHLYPAIAIPLQEKDTYECPREHVEALQTFLPSVTRMLIVGWSATEAHFLRLLAERVPRGVHGLVICQNADGARATLGRLKQAGVDVGDFHAFQHGFSHVFLGEEIDTFLRHSG